MKIWCFGKTFSHWSQDVVCDKDKTAFPYQRGFWGWIGKALFWKRKIVLLPRGHDDTRYHILLEDELGWMIFNESRLIRDGAFAMRGGIAPLKIKIVGDGFVSLINAGYVDGEYVSPEIGKWGIDVREIKLY